MEHIALYLRDVYLNKRTGRLLFRSADIKKFFFFQEGNLVFARTNFRQELFGEILYRAGKIPEEVYSRIEEFIRPKKKLGEVLVEERLLTEEDLKAGIAYQMREIILNIFPIFNGELKFQEPEETFEGSFDYKMDSSLLILEGIRRMEFNPVLLHFLEKKRAFRQNNDQATNLKGEERKVLDGIKEKMTTSELLKKMKVDPEFFWKSLYLFYCLDLIGFHPDKEIEDQDKSDKELSEDKRQRLDEAVDFAAKLGDYDYYQLLNVPRNAPGNEIKKRYFHMARKYHPDLFGKDVEQESKEIVQDLFTRISKAYQTLIDEKKRKAYDESLSGSRPIDQQDQVKRAESNYQKARVLYNQGRYEDARLLMEEAVRIYPEKGLYFLLLAVIESKDEKYQRKAETDFLKAINLEPWNADAMAGLGVLYQKAGLKVKAEKQFKKAMKLDPNNAVVLKAMSGGKEDRKKGLKDLLTLDLFGSGKKKK